MAQPRINIKQLGAIRQSDTPKGFQVAEALDDLKTALENMAVQLATQPNGAPLTPPDISAVNVQSSGILVDITIVDNGAIGRAINYHVEYDTVPSFSNPRGADLGAWRNFTLPLSNGNYYFRAYSQYQAGGPPSNPVNCAANPIVVGGGVALALLSSQASGTSDPDTGGGAGSGKEIGRLGYLDQL